MLRKGTLTDHIMDSANEEVFKIKHNSQEPSSDDFIAPIDEDKTRYRRFHEQFNDDSLCNR